MASLSFAPRKHFQRRITLPADKSILHRALILNAIAQGSATIMASDYGEDNKSTIKALQALGVEITQENNVIKIQGRGLQGLQAPAAALDCGNSGTTMRLLSGVLAAQNFESELIGDASLQQRPMQRIVTPLQSMGAKIVASEHGTAPLQIQPAKLNNIEYEMLIASAQVKSALLLAGLASGQTVTLFEPVSSRDHTERLLQAMQIKLEVEENRIHLPAQQRLQAMDVQVPGDFSAAAYFIAAACLAQRADVTLPQVNVNPTRTGLLRYLVLMGAPIKMQNQQWFGHEPVADIHIKTVKNLQAVQVRAEHIPSLIDELPLLFLLAACAQGTTVIPNVGELRHKECDRLQAMVGYLTAMGVAVTLEDDKIAITGQDELLGGEFDCLQDHRMAMTLAVASFASRNAVHIRQGDCFKVSFPHFLQAIR